MTSFDLFEQALAHHRAEKIAEAATQYRHLLKYEPHHDRSYYLLGLIALEANRLYEALELLRRAIECAPGMPVYHTNLGVTLHRLNRPQVAVDALMTSLSLNPDIAETHFNLGLALLELGQHRLACGAIENAADCKPDCFDIQFQLARILKLRGEHSRAIGHYYCALSLCPNSIPCLVELASTLQTLDRTGAAIGTLRRAVSGGPQSAFAHCELGAILAKRGEWDEAIDVLSRAVQLDPTAAEAHANLGVALGDSGRILECIESYRRALELRPESYAVHGNILYMMPFASQFDEEAMYNEARAWNIAYGEPLRATVRAHENDRHVDRRLRVGYVSPHFCDHCQSFFTLPLLTHHDRDRVEVFCYASVNLVDEITKQLQTRADVWRNVFHLDNAELAQLIRKDEIDILVDLTMHMENGRLPMFAHKPAPVQVSWLAYPGTTGVEAIDYRITDRHLDPPERYPQPYYSERSLVLPNTFWCYEPRHLDIDCGPLPARSNGYVTFGSLNHFRKINDEVIDLWAQVLNSVEGSRMLILAPQGKSRERVLSRFERRAIEATRITFFSRMPLREYLELYRHIDICLDSFPYGGHKTSLDASWMGVPVVSLLGSTIVGRASLTIASNLQMEHLVANTPREYVQCAAALASDRQSLEELRSTIRSRMMTSPLMDQARFARNLEDAYAAVWRIWCAGGTSDRSPLVITDRRE